MYLSVELIFLNFFTLFLSIFLISKMGCNDVSSSIKTKIILVLAFLIYSVIFLVFFFSSEVLDQDLVSTYTIQGFYELIQTKFLKNEFFNNDPYYNLHIFEKKNLNSFFQPTLCNILFNNIDSISVLFVLMSHIVAFMVICFSSIYFDFSNFHTNLQNLKNFKSTVILTLLMTLMMDLLFLTDNLLLIFFLAELSLFPLSFLMVKDTTIFWRKNKNELIYENKRPLALYYLVFFTVISGGFGLIGLIIIYFTFGTLSLSSLAVLTELNSNYLFGVCASVDLHGYLPLSEFNIIIFIFSLCCVLVWIAVKVPLAPVHIWLPKAHVEGSTESSMLLAGIILKITVYVFLRISCLPLFVILLEQYRPFLLAIAATTAISGAFGSLLTTDMKRITAYSSVSHMGIILSAGFYMPSSSIAITPFLILLLAHTIISTAMFMFIGCIYKSRQGKFVSRNRLSYGGLLFLFPTYFLFGAIIFSNLNIPLTVGFVGELGALITTLNSGLTLPIILSASSFILLLPMLAMLGQILLGPVRLVDFFLLKKPLASIYNIFYKQLVFNKIVWNVAFSKFYTLSRVYFFNIFLTVLGFGVFIGFFANFCSDFGIINDLMFLRLS